MSRGEWTAVAIVATVLAVAVRADLQRTPPAPPVATPTPSAAATPPPASCDEATVAVQESGLAFAETMRAFDVCFDGSGAPTRDSEHLLEAVEPYIIDITDQREHPAVRYEAWAAMHAAFPPEALDCAVLIAWRETRIQPWNRIIDVNGLPSEGAWHVQPRWWGTVPEDIEGQAAQVAGIVAAHGWQPWTTRGDC